ncbi:DmsC/YnfH family molybdoenzyme membrane anchor subunit [Pantoea sp. B65]|uniref:DmsC/YnfH family molybdoenzyme membrane anchor subunit n=1 Tax=Pantoea sp. B65 TaxID=2813359 RepID=UPI0039B6A777
MGNGWHEWPLILFTVLGQSVVGGLMVTGLAWLFAAPRPEQQRALVRAMFFLWLIMGLAFVASVLHLGSPLRALNSLNRLGSSALSNEIASGSLFFALGGLWWLVSILGKMPAQLGRVWMAIALLSGVLFVWAMTRVYQIATVPTWHNDYTTLGFFFTALLAGPLLGVLLLRLARFPLQGRNLALLSVAALLVSLAAIILQTSDLAFIHNAQQQAAALIPDYAMLQLGRVFLLVAGLGCWICPLVRQRTPAPAALLAGFVLVVAGEVIGRALFYGLHMTVGVAAA